MIPISGPIPAKGGRTHQTLAVELMDDLISTTGRSRSASFRDIRDHALLRLLMEGLRATEIMNMEAGDLPAVLTGRVVFRARPWYGTSRHASSEQARPMSASCGCRRTGTPAR